jgi:AcrR family transcriptional regulator
MDTETAAEVPSTRQRILQISLELMSQRGVDGTSMRDLAAACNLNVASLYHYFPSKRELLEAVLGESGMLPVKVRRPKPEDADPFVSLLVTILRSMFEVESFIRLMVGEAIRYEENARAVGVELFSSFETVLEDWITNNRPDLAELAGAGAMARLLTGVVVGLFVQHAAGVVDVEGDDLDIMILTRARETVQILNALTKTS